jgi:hypothetical protein
MVDRAMAKFGEVSTSPQVARNTFCAILDPSPRQPGRLPSAEKRKIELPVMCAK